MEETLQQLLDTLPKGEELTDPREGTYDEAVLSEVRLVANSEAAKIPFAFGLKFTGLEDVEGRDFGIEERANIPTSSSDPVIKRMFLATLHDLDVVPHDYKQAIVADTDEQRQALLAIVKKAEGAVYPINVKEKNGFVHVRIRRRRR